MAVAARSFLAATILTFGAAATSPLAAQATSLPEPSPARRFAFSVGTTSLPWRDRGVGATAELRVSRYLTVGAAGSVGSIGSGISGQRYGDSQTWEGRTTWYPQGDALRGWQVTAGVGRQRFGAIQNCVTFGYGGQTSSFGGLTTSSPQCFQYQESRTTASLLGGHQWLLGSTGRWTAGVSAGVRTSLGEEWAGQWRSERVQGVTSLRVGLAL
jgi:hypothetical protein